MPTALMHHGARYEPWRRTGTSLWLGASEMRIIIRHMVPSFSSHLFAVLTLRVPEMILPRPASASSAWGCASR